jgi:ABC-type transporter Mla subunit MlaD
MLLKQGLQVMNKNFSTIVGFVTVLFISGFVYFAYLVIDSKGYLEQKFNLYLKTEAADLFSEGMQIYYNGFSIGSIDRIKLEDSGDVVLKIVVKESNRKWIKSDAKFYLDKPLVGSPKIRVSKGKSNTLISQNSFIKITIKDGINDIVKQLQPVTTKLNNILVNIDKLIASLNNKDDHVQQILKNIDHTTRKFAKDEPILDTVIGDNKTIDDIKKIIIHIKQTLKEIKDASKSINTTTLLKTNKSIDEVNKILQDINKKLHKLDSTFDATQKVAPTIEVMQKDISSTIKTTDDLLQKANNYLRDNENSEVKLP